MSDVTTVQIPPSVITTPRDQANPIPRRITGQLSNSSGTLYTVPGINRTGKRSRVLFVHIDNTDSSAHTATMNFVVSAGSAAAANEFLSAKSIAANDYIKVDFGTEGMPLFEGETIRGVADAASKLTYHICLIEE